jgi:hypothetical protein
MTAPEGHGAGEMVGSEANEVGGTSCANPADGERGQPPARGRGELGRDALRESDSDYLLRLLTFEILLKAVVRSR